MASFSQRSPKPRTAAFCSISPIYGSMTGMDAPRSAMYLAKLPLERVWEVHLAGIEFAHGHWLDAHSGGIDPELAADCRRNRRQPP